MTDSEKWNNIRQYDTMEPSLEKTAHYASKYNGSENILDWVMKRISPSVLSLK